MFTFVTGGFRSGRSNYALRRACELGPPPWCYVSLGLDTDDAIAKRLEHHRRDQEAIWHTKPIPEKVADLVSPEALAPYGSVVIDGFSRWIEERLTAHPELSDAQLIADVEELADRLYRTTVPVVLVTREVGLARPPEDPLLKRAFRLTASANQILASSATHVSLLISGVPLRVR